MAWRIFEILSDLLSDKKDTTASKPSRSTRDERYEKADRNADRFPEPLSQRDTERRPPTSAPESETRTVNHSSVSYDKMQDAYRSAKGRIDIIAPEQEIRRAPPPRQNIREEFRETRSVANREDSRTKRPVAYYEDAAGVKQKIHYTELKKGRFLEARQHDLYVWDSSHTHKLRLQVRQGPGFPHFWRPDRRLRSELKTRNQFEDAPENDCPPHEARISEIIDDIGFVKPQKIITRDFQGVTSEQFVLANINGYSWRANTTQIKLSGAKVRPDIIGELEGQPASEMNPRIFIEVINTHFPSENTWNAYCKASMNIRSPVIVCFDFMSNYHFQVREEDAEKHRPESDIRTIYYLWHGSLWKNTSQLFIDKIADYTSDNFKALMEQDAYRPKLNGTTSNGSGFNSGPSSLVSQR